MEDGITGLGVLLLLAAIWLLAGLEWLLLGLGVLLIVLGVGMARRKVMKSMRTPMG